MKKNNKIKPLLNQQKKSRQPPSEYFYIRVMEIQIKNKTQKQKQIKKDSNDNVDLILQMGNKVCKTSFNLRSVQQKFYIHKNCVKQVMRETHLFSYQGEQVLNIRMKCFSKVEKDTKKQKQKQQNKNTRIQEKQGYQITNQGFCRVPITSFILFPYTCHQLNVRLIKIGHNDQFQPEIVAFLKIQLFFILKFEATLKIYPHQGNFQAVSPDLGQMNLCFSAKINNQRKKSDIQSQGGIHPKWHLYGLKQNIKKNKDNKGLYEGNILQFKLKSVGQQLEIDIINFPLLDRDAQIVGSCRLKLQNQDFFRVCNRRLSEETSKKTLQMNFTDQQSKILKSGQIVIAYQFIFDIQKKRKQIMGEDY